MADDLYARGFAAGWLAASQAFVEALGAINPGGTPVMSLAAAADKPMIVQRRRGRPPKSAAGAAEQPKRRRGRPRKSEKA